MMDVSLMNKKIVVVLLVFSKYYNTPLLIKDTYFLQITFFMIFIF